jgi:hypothetical protein
MTAKEFAEELFDANVWKRVPRTHIRDKPFYPYVLTDPKQCVNFDLNYPCF